uniref:Andersonin-9 peptide n=1 Tax=Odorrana andersonii TaxID=369514 RepID=E3SZM3_ODOAN|nr:andersonin-9 peptide precursor [Odorrana andersonii]
MFTLKKRLEEATRHLQPHRTSPAELTGTSYTMTWINENLHRHRCWKIRRF